MDLMTKGRLPKNLVQFALVLLVAFTTLATKSQASAAECEARSVREGDAGKVICRFAVDVKKHRDEVSVQRYSLNAESISLQPGDFETVLDCDWRDGGKFSCDSKPGYSVVDDVGTTLSLIIHNASSRFVGKYMCLLRPAEPDQLKPCVFELREEHGPRVTTNHQDPSHSHGDKTGQSGSEQGDIHTGGSNIALLTSVAALAVTTTVLTVVLVAVFVFWFRKRKSKRTRDKNQGNAERPYENVRLLYNTFRNTKQLEIDDIMIPEDTTKGTEEKLQDKKRAKTDCQTSVGATPDPYKQTDHLTTTETPNFTQNSEDKLQDKKRAKTDCQTSVGATPDPYEQTDHPNTAETPKKEQVQDADFQVYMRKLKETGQDEKIMRSHYEASRCVSFPNQDTPISQSTKF